MAFQKVLTCFLFLRCYANILYHSLAFKWVNILHWNTTWPSSATAHQQMASWDWYMTDVSPVSPKDLRAFRERQAIWILYHIQRTTCETKLLMAVFKKKLRTHRCLCSRKGLNASRRFCTLGNNRFHQFTWDALLSFSWKSTRRQLLQTVPLIRHRPTEFI